MLNHLAQREAAIVSPLAGTTRDIIEVPIAIAGIPYRFADTAGLHDGGDDVIEAEGMARARRWLATSDLLLWLGNAADAPDHPRLARVAAQADRAAQVAGWADRAASADIILSARTGEGMDQLHAWLNESARLILPVEGEVALNQRQADALARAADSLAGEERDLILIAERLRAARVAIDGITGRAGTEAMLDALFGRFCIGK